MADLTYKDQTRNGTSLHQRHQLIDLKKQRVPVVTSGGDVESLTYAADDPDLRTAQAIPIVTSQVIPVDENEDLRNQVRVLQEQMGQLQKQGQEDTGYDQSREHGDNQTTTIRPTQRKRILFGGVVVAAVAIGIIFLVTFFSVWNDDVPSNSQAASAGPITPVPVACEGFPVANTTHIVQSGIQGSLPTCLGFLTALTRLDLRSGARLTGTIPSQLGQLTALRDLFLDNNPLTGTIPSELGQLSALTSLWLGYGRLGGTIPRQLGQLTALRFLLLYNNHLTGTIPSQLGQLTILTTLVLENNHLEGIIPAQLGRLRALKRLWLQDNQLTGTVPAFLANIGDTDVSGNNFSST